MLAFYRLVQYNEHMLRTYPVYRARAHVRMSTAPAFEACPLRGTHTDTITGTLTGTCGG